MLCQQYRFSLALCILALLGLALAQPLHAQNGDSPLGSFVEEELPSYAPQTQPSSSPSPSPSPKPSWHVEDYDREEPGIGEELAGSLILGFAGYCGLWAKGVATTHTKASFTDQEPIPYWEFEANSQWFFESKLNRNLVTGNSLARTRDLQWQGTHGFHFAARHQSLDRIGTELILDFAKDEEQNQYPGMNRFLTIPAVSFPLATSSVSRDSLLMNGQFNMLLRGNPSVFAVAGLRWWHHSDELAFETVTLGPSWRTNTKVNAPLFQFGVQFGNLGKRLHWRNRFTFGLGPAWGESETRVAGIVGSVDRLGAHAARLMTLTEAKSELGWVVNQRLRLSLGAQLLGITSGLRPASQIEVSNLQTGVTRLRNDSILYSSLYCGLTLSL